MGHVIPSPSHYFSSHPQCIIPSRFATTAAAPLRIGNCRHKLLLFKGPRSNSVILCTISEKCQLSSCREYASGE